MKDGGEVDNDDDDDDYDKYWVKSTYRRQFLPCIISTALRQATDKRCLQDLEATIKTAECSCVNSELWQTSALKNAGDLLQRLRRFKLYLPKILELKSSTVSEIHSYKRPRPLVHNVMIATYLLLGESEPKLMVSAKNDNLQFKNISFTKQLLKSSYLLFPKLTSLLTISIKWAIK